MMNEQQWYEEQKQQHFSNADKKQKRGGAVSFAVLIICMLITGLIGGAAGGLVAYNAREDIAPPQTQGGTALPDSTDISAPAPSAQQSAPVPALQTNAGQAYTKSQIIEKCAPSIVGIDVQASGMSGWYGGGSVVQGSGSGIIISADGYIVTNNHVVEGASEITVYLSDDTEYVAELIGSDAKTDLAVIKIEAAGLVPVQLGDSGALVVGEDVLAIGNPLGELRGTATSGMVSALSRSVSIDGQDMTLLQTDAAINPGNSGGGLFDMNGRLIGVVNAKIASSQTEGLGFAIPVNDMKAVLNDLIDLGYVSGRAYLGVYMQDVYIESGNTQRGNSIEDFFGFFGGQRAYETRVEIIEVVAGAAADKAGLKAGDFILAVDGEEITGRNQLANVIREYNAGDAATIKIQRDGSEMTVSVTFDERLPEEQS